MIKLQSKINNKLYDTKIILRKNRHYGKDCITLMFTSSNGYQLIDVNITKYYRIIL